MAAQDPNRYMELVALPFANPDPNAGGLADGVLIGAFAETATLSTSTFIREIAKDGDVLEHFKAQLVDHGVTDERIKEIIACLRLADGMRANLNSEGRNGTVVLTNADIEDLLNNLTSTLCDDELEFWDDQVFIDALRSYLFYCHDIHLPRQDSETGENWLPEIYGPDDGQFDLDAIRDMVSQEETGMSQNERRAAAREPLLSREEEAALAAPDPETDAPMDKGCITVEINAPAGVDINVIINIT